MLSVRTRPVVADVMTQVVVTVPPDMTVPELAELLAQRHISGAPIVDPAGEVLGVVSSSDILRAQVEGSDEGADAALALEEVGARAPSPSTLSAGRREATVLDIGTRQVVSLDERTPLAEAAKVLLELGIHRALVTRRGRLAGILTATDILKWVALPALEADEG